MPNVLILTEVQEAMRARYKAMLLERFPQLTINVVGHHNDVDPYIANVDILLCFSPPMADHVVRDAPKLKWIQALGTGVDNIIDLPSLGKEVVVTNVRGIHGAPVSEATIAFMLSLGFVTRYGGTDATLGLAFTRTGVLYPFFAAMLGWLGVALTGSDTSSNVLFGSLQKITAQQLGLNPILITTANSTGGVMGKMIDAQSIVVATAATNQQGQEGRILRFVFWHSVALATIMGIIVMLQAYVFPWMVPEP